MLDQMCVRIDHARDDQVALGIDDLRFWADEVRSAFADVSERLAKKRTRPHRFGVHHHAIYIEGQVAAAGPREKATARTTGPSAFCGMRSISAGSSPEKMRLSSAATFASSCAMLAAPGNAEVTRGSRNVHASAV